MLNYEELLKSLEDVTVIESPSFLQGWMVALLLAEGKLNLSSFELSLNEELGDEVLAHKDLLFQLLEQTNTGLNATDLSLQLILPDTEDLRFLAESIGLWAEGFIYGLGLTNVVTKTLPKDLLEAIEDVANIASIDTSDIDSTPENEVLLLELEEFLRIVAINLNDTLHPKHHGHIEVSEPTLQ